MTTERSTKQKRWILVGVFSLFASLYILTAFGRIDSFDGEMMYRVTQSLLERHSLVVSDEIFHTNEPYAVYGLGQSIFVLPLYALGKLLGVDTRWMVSLFNPLVTALTASLIYYLGSKMGFSSRISLFLTFCFGLASLAWPYSKTFFSEPLIALLLLSGVAAAMAFRDGGRSLAIAVLGIVLGAAVLTREDTLLILPFFIAYLVWPRSKKIRIGVKEAVFFLIPFAIFLAITWWYHDLRFHSLLSGYVEKTGNRFEWTPGTFFTGIYGQLISSGKGLFLFTPVIALSVLSWRRFWKQEPLLCGLFTILVLERITFFAFLVRWYGGVAWGPRYIVPIIPCLILPIGFLLDTPDWARIGRRAIIGGLFVLSFLAQLPGIAVYYALYWNATIGTRQIIPDQIFFSPQFSPLVGQFRWMMEGKDVQWLLHVPQVTWEWPFRFSLVLVGLIAIGLLIWLHRSGEFVTKKVVAGTLPPKISIPSDR